MRVVLASTREQAQLQVDTMIARTRDVLSEATGPSSADRLRKHFLQFMNDTEQRLYTLFSSVQPAYEFESPRLLAILSGTVETAQMFSTVQAEAAKLRRWLQAVLESLKPQLPINSLSIVPDTNVLLHFLPVDKLPWVDLVNGTDDITVVIPLAVLDELDDKKNAKDPGLSGRAKAVAKQLEGFAKQAEQNGGITELTPGKRVAFLSEQRGHVREPNTDAEIVAVCRDLGDQGLRVLLATGDLGMRTRARSSGVEPLSLGDELRLPIVDPTAMHVKELTRELAAIKAAAPQLSVSFSETNERLDFRDSAAVTPQLIDADVLVDKIASECPPLEPNMLPAISYMRISADKAADYNRRRDAWLQAIRQNVRLANIERVTKADSDLLLLFLWNTGGALATGLRIQLVARPDYEFVVPVGFLTEPTFPGPPTHPFEIYKPRLGSSFQAAVPVQPLEKFEWKVRPGGVADISVPRIRHGGETVEMPPIYLMPRAGTRRKGATIGWKCLTDDPPLTDQGTLHLRPRE